MAAAIGWSPETFWKVTLTEFFCAIEGWNLAHGSKAEAGPLSRNEYDELLAEYGGTVPSIREGH